MNQRIKSSLRLPTLPSVAVEVLNLFNDPEARIDRITDVIESDPAICGKVLKAANSPRYGLRGKISDTRRAIALLGRNNITPLVLSFSLASDSMEDSEYADQYKQFLLRSFVRANAAEVLGEQLSPEFGAECFAVNLLAGIGQLGILEQAPEAYVECLERLRSEQRPLSEIERDAFGLTHGELTSEMLEKIGLPERCVNAVRNDSSAAAYDTEDRKERSLSAITRCADAVARYLCDPDPGLSFIVLEERLIEVNEFRPTDKENLLAQVRDRLEVGSDLFNIDPSELPDSSELLDSALEQLSDFTAMIHEPNAERNLPSELVEENGRLKRRVEDLIEEATTDGLTRVRNRAFFDIRLMELQAISLIRGQQFGIVLIDIDHFKKINDTYGHQAGDHVLKEVAQALNISKRAKETLARYGGEEFAILLENTTPDGMDIVGERLRSAVEILDIRYKSHSISVTISVGIACGRPTKDECFPIELLGLADAALYQAKQQGRNRVVVDSSLSRMPDPIPGPPAMEMESV
jgi:diguanylate cyclase (GGDEF)-like protein